MELQKNTPKSINCPKCGFSEHVDRAEFCERCGESLTNKCSNPDCSTRDFLQRMTAPIREKASYCHRCGAETTFKRLGILDNQF